MTTILDDVLQAEKAADNAIADAKVAATRAATDANQTHDTALKQEAEKLAGSRSSELAAYQSELEAIKNETVKKTEADVADVKEQFAKKHDELVELVISRIF